MQSPEMVVRCTEVTGLLRGQAAYISGSVPNVILEGKRAKANSATTMPSCGLVSLEGRNGDVVEVTRFGVIRGINTAAWALGDVLYVSPTTAGALTNAKPVFPDLVQECARVLTVHASVGEIQAQLLAYPASMATEQKLESHIPLLALATEVLF